MKWKLYFSGKIHHTEVYDMLKNIDPPLGFGNKCPYRLAYKKLIRMNMPVDEDGKVNFKTTLFALIRENLNIKMRGGNLLRCQSNCQNLRESFVAQPRKWTMPMMSFVKPFA